jgi:hypothetical protein
MTNNNDLGPLALLVGKWRGGSGKDIAPEPDGVEDNAYYETLEFSVVGDVSNAEIQTLETVQYEQVVRRQSNDKLLHHQIGYFTWDPDKQIVCNGFTIPRRVAVLAGGTVTNNGSKTIFDVSATLGSDGWAIVESGFMAGNASTRSFKQMLCVEGDSLMYEQMMLVDIYGKKSFEHSDKNTLSRVLS